MCCDINVVREMWRGRTCGNVMRNVVQWWRDVEWRDVKGGVIKFLWCDVMETVKIFNVVWDV